MFLKMVLTSLTLALIIVLLYILIKMNHKASSKILQSSFECGIDSKGQSHGVFSLKFMYITILFIIFDLEIILMLMLPFLQNYFSFLIMIFITTILLLGLVLEYYNNFLQLFT
uniref:NADH dehydrogenase subunit 3 n=1 Tax=Parachordodes pustulosus TaxID=3049253 RepID=UPI002E79F171|nr:NADH dehydrogenase subunit 3 [Parachordodes pustulosus]WQH58888.1 NADH dehydrogenase subunit 3 [Parachordodes pustulosus]